MESSWKWGQIRVNLLGLHRQYIGVATWQELLPPRNKLTPPPSPPPVLRWFHTASLFWSRMSPTTRALPPELYLYIFGLLLRNDLLVLSLASHSIRQLAILYHFDRRFSHRSQAPLTCSWNPIHHRSQRAVNSCKNGHRICEFPNFSWCRLAHRWQVLCGTWGSISKQVWSNIARQGIKRKNLHYLPNFRIVNMNLISHCHRSQQLVNIG
jgi:hypothetical protein